MSPLAESGLGASIVANVALLEKSLVRSEDLLVARAWSELEMQLAEQRRITHAIAIDIAQSDGERPADFNLELRRRLQAIEMRRADQMRRLEAFHDAVGTRLAVMARAKAMRRETRDPQIDSPALLDSRQ